MSLTKFILKTYIDKTWKQTTEQITESAVKLFEIGERRHIYDIIDKITKLEVSSFSFPQIELIIIAIVKYLEINLKEENVIPEKTMELLGSCLKRIRKKKDNNIKLDWKLFYKIANINSNFYTLSAVQSTLDQIKPFIRHNFLIEDYLFIKKDFLFYLYHFANVSQFKKGFMFLFWFVPNEFLQKDTELQDILFNYFKNSTFSNNLFCSFFQRILKAKTYSLSPNINFETFCEIYFSKLELYSNNKVLTGFINDLVYTKNQSKEKDSFEVVLFLLLFSPSLKEYRPLIEQHLSLMLDKLLLTMSANRDDDETNLFALNFYSSFVFCLFRKFLKKKKNKVIKGIKGKKVRRNNIYKKNKEMFERLVYLINGVFWNTIKMFFLYCNTYSVELVNISLILMHYPKEIPKLDEMVDLCNIYLKNEDIQKYITSFSCILYLLIREKDLQNKKVVDMLIAGTNKCIEMISTNNKDTLDLIFVTLEEIYLLSHYVKEHSKKINNFFIYLNETALFLYKKIIPIFDCIKSVKNYENCLYSINNFISKETSKEIDKLLIDYVLNTEIEYKNISLYLNKIKNSEYLFSYSLSSIVIENDEHCNKIQQHFIYDTRNVNNIELLISTEKQFLFYQNIFCNISLYDVDIIKFKKEIFNVVYCLINQNHSSYKYGKLLRVFLSTIIEELCLMKRQSDKDEYYNIKDIKFVIEIYETFVLPYINSISCNDINDEQKLFVFLSLSHCFIYDYGHIFINYTDEIKDYDILPKEFINIYKQYNTILNNIIKVTQGLVPVIMRIKEENDKYHLSDILNSILAKHINSHQHIKKENFNKYSYDYYQKYYETFYDNKSVSYWRNSCYYDKAFLLFKAISKKEKEYSDSLSVLLCKFDRFNFFGSHILSSNNSAICLSLYDTLYNKYIKDIDAITNNPLSIADKKRIDNIIYNISFLAQMKIKYSNEDMFEIVFNEIIVLFSKILSKNYQKSNVLYLIIKDLLWFYGKYFISETSKGKNEEYPHLNKLIITSIKETTKYMDIILKNKDEIEQSKEKFMRNKETYVITVNKIINDTIEAFVVNNNELFNSQLHKAFYIGTVLYFFVMQLDIKKKENKELLYKILSISIKFSVQKSIPYIYRKIWMEYVYGILLLINNKYSLKYEITFYTEDEYTKNMSQIIRKAKSTLINLNSVPVEYIIKNVYKDIHDINISISFEELYQSLLEINDWESENKLNKKASYIFNIHIRSFSPNIGIIPSNNQSNDLLNYIKGLMTYYSFESIGDYLNLQNWSIIYYLLKFNVIPFDSLIYDNLIEKYNKRKSENTLKTITECICGLIIYELNIKKDLLNSSKRLISMLCMFYTNLTNKRIDYMLEGLFTFFLSSVTLEQLEIFFEHYLELLPDFFCISMFKYLSLIYSNSIIFLQNKDIVIKKIEHLFEKCNTSRQFFLEAKIVIPSLISIYSWLKGLIVNEKRLFTTTFSNEVPSFLDNFMLSIYTNNKENKECKLLFEELLINYGEYFNKDYERFIKLTNYIGDLLTLSNESNEVEDYKKEYNLLINSFPQPINKYEIINSMCKYIMNNKDIKCIQFLLLQIELIYDKDIHQLTIIKKHSYEQQWMMILQLLSTLKKYKYTRGNLNNFFLLFFITLPDEENKMIAESIYMDNKYKELYRKNYIENDDSLYGCINQLNNHLFVLPNYIQKMIVEIGKKFKTMNEKEKSIIKNAFIEAYNKYQYTFYYMKEFMSKECEEVLMILSKNDKYFI